MCSQAQCWAAPRAVASPCWAVSVLWELATALPHPAWQGQGKHRLVMGFQQAGECQELLTGSECLLSWLNFDCCCCETGNFII